MAEATWPATTALELELAAGFLSPAERRRAEAAGVRSVSKGTAPDDGTVVVLDVPDPTRAATRFDPRRLVVFDDAEGFDGDAAAIVQPSSPTWHGRARAAKVMAGYAWAPIGESWRRLVSGTSSTEPVSRRGVLVCFGGSDPDAVTARLGPAIADDPAWATTIVVGHGYRGPWPTDVDLAQDPVDLPDRVAAADLVVLGAGTMKFEVAALGKPALLVAAADDQLPVGPPFAATGAARWLGDGRTIDPDIVRRAVRELLSDREARDAMSSSARRVVDGLGADRLAREILTLAG